MKKENEFVETRSPEELKAQKERSYKLITFFSIGGILMMFIGWISAVVVSKMDGFWLNLILPSAFYTSTIVIILSSITFFLARRFAINNNQTGLKSMLVLTFLLGVAFVYFQFQGWKTMVQSGNYFSGGIYFEKGAYGDRFVVLKEGKEIHFDGNYYSLEGDTLSAEEVNDIKSFVYPICQEDRKFINRPYELTNYGAPYSLGWKGKTALTADELGLKEGKLTHHGAELSLSDRSTLFAFSFGINHDTPFFGVKGIYGKDFTISLNGQVLDFIDRRFYFPSPELTEDDVKGLESTTVQGGVEYVVKDGKVYAEGKEVQVNDFVFKDKSTQRDVYISNGQWYEIGEEISSGQYNKFFQTNNTASSYIYVLSGMHALHILLGFGLLLVLLVRSFKGYYHSEHYTGLTVGGYFWHFLGILWLGLFLFWMGITI